MKVAIISSADLRKKRAYKLINGLFKSGKGKQPSDSIKKSEELKLEEVMKYVSPRYFAPKLEYAGKFFDKVLYWKDRNKLISKIGTPTLLLAFVLTIMWIISVFYIIYLLLITGEVYAQILSVMSILLLIYVFSLLLFFELIKPIKVKKATNRKFYKYTRNKIYYSLSPQCDLFGGNAGLPLYSLLLHRILAVVL